MLSQATIEQPMAQRIAPFKNKVLKSNLLVHEIYSSIQGESSYMGMPCIFVRTTGCHLRCSYCDTEHAFFKGQELNIDEILFKIKSFGIPMVEVTGGEPLLQEATFTLLDRLARLDYLVLLETSGAVSIEKVNPKVKVILDIKTPSSLESKKNVLANLNILWPGCEVKFVIGTHEDYLFAKKFCEDHDLYNRTHVLFSPVVARIDPKLLVTWILEDKLNIRFQLQLHRVLYGEEPGK
jgi:7-carboxy-7-deazaguanine synthase